MKNKNEYDITERVKLCDKYRRNGEMCQGGEDALKWYKRGIAMAIKSDKFDHKNYEYYYDVQKHYFPYEIKGKWFFDRAAKCFKHSAELGNELAMMNYALYLFAYKKNYNEALKWFLAASNAGLAAADYELFTFYKNGYCGVDKDEEMAKKYFQRYKIRCEESERQLMLSWGIDENNNVIGVTYMFVWFSGNSVPLIYDTPRAIPSKWRLETYKD